MSYKCYLSFFQLLLERISPLFFYEPVPQLTRSFIMDLLTLYFLKNIHMIFLGFTLSRYCWMSLTNCQDSLPASSNPYLVMFSPSSSLFSELPFTWNYSFMSRKMYWYLFFHYSWRANLLIFILSLLSPHFLLVTVLSAVKDILRNHIKMLPSTDTHASKMHGRPIFLDHWFWEGKINDRHHFKSTTK